jgi:hypothetical protein
MSKPSCPSSAHRFIALVVAVGLILLTAHAGRGDEPRKDEPKKPAEAKKDEPKKPDGEGSKKEEMKKEDAPKKEKLNPFGTLNGEIVRIEGNTLIVRIQGQRPRNPYFAQAMNEFEITMADEVKVRLPPKPELDEKGRPKNTTPKKDPSDPDSKLGGIRGSTGDLKPRQFVTIHLGQTREKQPKVLATVIYVLADPPMRKQ